MNRPKYRAWIGSEKQSSGTSISVYNGVLDNDNPDRGASDQIRVRVSLGQWAVVELCEFTIETDNPDHIDRTQGILDQHAERSRTFWKESEGCNQALAALFWELAATKEGLIAQVIDHLRYRAWRKGRNSLRNEFRNLMKEQYF